MNDILNDDVLTSKEIISNLKTFEVLINLNIKIQNFVFFTFQQQQKLFFPYRVPSDAVMYMQLYAYLFSIFSSSIFHV